LTLHRKFVTETDLEKKVAMLQSLLALGRYRGLTLGNPDRHRKKLGLGICKATLVDGQVAALLANLTKTKAFEVTLAIRSKGWGSFCPEVAQAP
jgi:hypothetical protein